MRKGVQDSKEFWLLADFEPFPLFINVQLTIFDVNNIWLLSHDHLWTCMGGHWLLVQVQPQPVVVAFIVDAFIGLS